MPLLDRMGVLRLNLGPEPGPRLAFIRRRAVAAVARRRFLVPEVIQSSAMDCGPAALKALLGGFGIAVSYGRLREAGQTDVDGTSLDTLEELANLLGLEADQIMIPPDHLFVEGARALPAIVAVRRPDGTPHFVVAWRKVGRWVQVMDPAGGRRWTTCERFRRSLFVHTHRVAATAWREWAAGKEFLDVLATRISKSGGGEIGPCALVQVALATDDWSGLATLDAKTRMVADLVEAGAVRRGREARALLEGLASSDVPGEYWSVREAKERSGATGGDPAAQLAGTSATPGDETEDLLLRGAVLVAVRGIRSRVAPAHATRPQSETASVPPSPLLGREALANLTREDPKPGRTLLELLREDGLLTPSVLAAGLFVSAAAVILEALLLRGLLDVGNTLAAPSERFGVMAALLAFLGALLLADVSIGHGLAHLGRHLEVRLRMALLHKLPRLEDRYLRSRLHSDMAQRAHLLHRVRNTTGLGGRLVRDVCELLLVAAAIAWLDPRLGLLAFAAAGFVVAVPLAAQRRLGERDLCAKSQSAALGRFYLDALLGLTTIRACSGERAFVREHEMQTSVWARAALDLQRGLVRLQAVQLTLGFGFAAWILTSHVTSRGVTGTSLLLVYWAMRLPAIGDDVVRIAGLYPGLRNIVARLLEPLSAPEEESPKDAPSEGVSRQDGSGESVGTAGKAAAREAPRLGAVHIRFDDVSIGAGGTFILEDVTLDLPPGTHTAVVGHSGAGKSTLVASLLGFHRTRKGSILADGRPLRGADLDRLRRDTAWVDPDVQLWNRSFLDNVTYGLEPGREAEGDLSGILRKAEADSILDRLPDGMATRLGEGGGLLSGGEGQRVRLARALLRPGIRLVLLDEALRGLDRETRSTLLQRCREHWSAATLVYVTHDLWLTQTFDQVVVVEQGRVAEVGKPMELLAAPTRYRELVAEEKEVHRSIWESPIWRRLRLDKGRLREVA